RYEKSQQAWPQLAVPSATRRRRWTRARPTAAARSAPAAPIALCLVPRLRGMLLLVPAAIWMPGQQRFVLEQENQRRAGCKPAHVRPECNSATLRTDGGKPADELHQDPVTQHPDRRDCERGDVEAEQEKHVHMNARIQHDVSTHH